MTTSIIMVTKHSGINYDKYLQKEMVNQKHTLNIFFSFCVLCPIPLKLPKNWIEDTGFNLSLL